MNSCAQNLAIAFIAAFLISVGLAADTPSSRPSGSAWHSVKTADGSAKNKPTRIRFKISSPQWRLTISSNAQADDVATPGATGGSDGATISVQLLGETLRDIDNAPVNWTPIARLINGKPGETGTKVFDKGLRDDGSPKWFEFVITGHHAHYDITVEDQSAGAGGSDAKPKRKKKSP